MQTPGAVRLPPAGMLRLSDAVSAASWAGKRFLIAECASYKGPAETTDWTFEPAAAGNEELLGSFRFANGRLYLQMKGGGTMFLFR